MERPLGKAALVGPQCRYLVGSSQLGAVGYAASARRLVVRDRRPGRQDAEAAPAPHCRVEPHAARGAAASRVLSLSLQDDDAGLRGVLRLPSMISGDLCRRITRACRCEPGSCRLDLRTRAAGPDWRPNRSKRCTNRGCRAALGARPVVSVPLARACRKNAGPRTSSEMRRWEICVWLTVRTAPRSPFSVAAGGNMAAVTGFLPLPSTRCRHDMTDREWRLIEPLLPRECPGSRRRDDRQVIGGILWVLPSGAPWRDPPPSYGPYTKPTIK